MGDGMNRHKIPFTYVLFGRYSFSERKEKEW